MERTDIEYHVLDDTTAWNEFIMYVEICHQLDVPGQPSLGRYMAFRRYLERAGLLND